MYRILIADDEGIMVESLKTIITSSFGDECEIACAKTGRAVVEQAESFRPDIALVDIQMPGLNGIQAIKEVRKFNQNTIFIIISAYDKFHYAQEAINLGVLEYLMKPVNKKKILEVCTKAMQLVDETRKKRSDDLKIREKLEIVVPVIESGYIYNLLLLDEFQIENDENRPDDAVLGDIAEMIGGDIDVMLRLRGTVTEKETRLRVAPIRKQHKDN